LTARWLYYLGVGSCGQSEDELDRESAIRSKLQAAFAPEALEVQNESHRHHGHAGAGSDTHFRVTIVSKAFEGKARLERHRMVNDILSTELGSGLHALAIKALTPNEARGLSL
jgi:BolA family transcriptional regulator, general stress-responsive regulator